MSKIIRACNCDYSYCNISDHRKHVHVDDECVHANNFHHKIMEKFVKNRNKIIDIDFKRRFINWGM